MNIQKRRINKKVSINRKENIKHCQSSTLFVYFITRMSQSLGVDRKIHQGDMRLGMIALIFIYKIYKNFSLF